MARLLGGTVACGEHEFGEPVPIGGGIGRCSCSRCGAVHLEVLREDTLFRSGLFQQKRARWMSWEPPVPQVAQTFGKRPERRRRVARAVA
jgi:hypothetical protein